MTVWTDATSGDEMPRSIQDDRRRNQQARTARVAQATSVSEGVFRVHSGASIRVEGGGDIEVTDGGDIRLPDGGTLTISGGSLVMNDETGSIGLLYFGPNAAGNPAWFFSFDDGELAGGLFGDPGSTYWAWIDRQGHDLVASDGATGVGLARPYLNIPMVPSAEAQHQSGGPFWPATDSAAYVELMHGFTTVWNPRIAFGMGTAASGGATEWELRISGELIASGSGNASGIYTIPGWGDEGGINPGDEKVIQVNVRNTGGVVSWAQVDRCYGLQS